MHIQRLAGSAAILDTTDSTGHGKFAGLIDTLVGGVGLRRGRRHTTDIRSGDAIDFWIVVAVEPGRTLELSAEMKLPGQAWLTWSVEEHSGATVVSQDVFFQPKGLIGRLYWYALLPFHIAIFGNMLSNVAHAAESRSK
jgi:hypothetical protein